MRKLILILCLSLPAFGNISATMQWDVRTTGSDSNSGGFDPSVTTPGTDYSQQNSPQISYTDLLVGATTTKYTSVLNVVSSALPGNTLIITGGTGCTTGTFEILSNTTITATVDRSLGTAASVCTAVLGGSKLTLAALSSLMVSGNTVNIKAGAYTLSSTTVLASLASATYIGYQTSHLDGGTKPLFTTATNSTDLFDAPGGVQFVNISFSNTAGTPANGIVKTNLSQSGTFINCTFSGFTSAINGDNVGAHYVFAPVLLVQNTEISASTYCVNNQQNSQYALVYIVDSFLHNCSTAGVEAGSSGAWTIAIVINSVLYGNGIGIQAANNVELIASIIANSTTNGVSSLSTLSSVNSIFYNNGAYGVSLNGGGGISSWTNNAYGSNGSGVTSISLRSDQTANDVTLTANPFVSSSNFALNNTAGGGAALKAAGFPGVSPAGTGYLDIGALQSKAASGSGVSPHAYVQ
jgi:hypothetical protein